MTEEQNENSLDPYLADGGKVYHETIYGNVGPRGYLLISERRSAKIQSHILLTDTVLEYGVGPGWNLAAIKAKIRRGYDVASVVKPTVEANGIEFISEISPKEYGVYDVVICSHVLEHMMVPGEALNTILKCLRPGGKALFFLPFDFERKFRRYDKNEPNHHLYSWNVQSFANLLLRHGYFLNGYRLRPFGYERIIAIWVEKYYLPNWAYAFLVNIALLIKPSYEIAFEVTKRI